MFRKEAAGTDGGSEFFRRSEAARASFSGLKVLENLEQDLLKHENKVRFILGIVEGKITVMKRNKADIFHEEQGFTPFPKKTKVEEAGDYDYLLQIPIGSLTVEGVQKLLKERDQLKGDVDEMRKGRYRRQQLQWTHQLLIPDPEPSFSSTSQ